MKKKEIHTYYNYQFKHTAVRVTNHPDIQTENTSGGTTAILSYMWVFSFLLRQKIPRGDVLLPCSIR